MYTYAYVHFSAIHRISVVLMWMNIIHLSLSFLRICSTRQVTKRKLKGEAVWTRLPHKSYSPPSRPLARMVYYTFGLGGFMRVLHDADIQSWGLRRGFLEYVLVNETSELGKILHFCLLCSSLRLCDEEEVS